MSEEIYIDEKKEFVINAFCGKKGVKMFQITIGTDYIQLNEDELNRMMAHIIQYQMKHFDHPRIKPVWVKKKR